MGVDAELSRLYSLPPDRFVGERDQLARRLRDDGRREDAKRVRRTRKPPFPVWVANRLAERAPREIGELVEAAERLEAGDGGADERFRSALERVLGLAPGVVDEAGRRSSDATLKRVLATLRSAAADRDARRALLEGRLADTPRASGFEAMARAAAHRGGGSRRARPASRRRRTRSDAAARRAVADARSRARELERRAESAEREARRVRSRAERAAAAARKAEERLAARAPQ